MFQSFKTLTALALIASGSAAHATLSYTQTTSFNTGGIAVTDYSADFYSALGVAGDIRSTALNFGAFNTNSGVLVGARTAVTIDNSFYVSINGAGPPADGDARRAVGSGYTRTALQAGNLSDQTGTRSSGRVRCGDLDWGAYPDTDPVYIGPWGECSQYNMQPGWRDQLGTYASRYAEGTLSAYLSAPAVHLSTTVVADLERREQFFPGLAWATSQVSQSGTASLTYEYLQHANASFSRFSDQNTLTLDFGEVLQGSIIPSLQYSLFNLGGFDTINMTVNGVTGGNSRFTNAIANANAAPFGQISTSNDQGGLFTARMMTDTLGAVSTAYFLRVGDSNIGGVGMQESTLTLILRGSVVAADAAEQVPEPATLGLFGLGALGLGIRRRQRVSGSWFLAL